jgi:Lrp/AsnC family transcriptional regulator for asnA, asnC and gidA
LTQCAASWENRCALRTPRPPEPRNAQRTGPVGRARLDAVDRAIVEALQRNGRESFRHIASEIGVSEATIRARYARLVDERIVQVTGVTNPLGLGFEAMAIVGVRTNGSPEDVASQLEGWEEASYVVVTAGRFDLLVELVCSDRRHLLEITNRIRALPGVVSTESFVYLELRKQLYDWGTQGVGGIATQDGPGVAA